MAIAEKAQPSGVGGGVAKITTRIFSGMCGLIVLLYAPIGEAAAQAPIIYATPGKLSAQNNLDYQKVASAPTQTASLSTDSRRTEYRYPDQPDMVFGAYGPRRVGNSDAPLAFSSSEAAIDVASAKRITGAPSSNTRTMAQPVSSNRNGYAKQKVGSPYQVKGRWYVPAAEPDYDEVGVGSWYGPQFNGRKTATGEVFNMELMTAAHTTLPIPSIARVTNLENGRTIIVRINDRGPFIDNRIIDLSKKAAETIGYKEKGKAKVRVEYLGPAPAEHNSLPAKYDAYNKRVARSGSEASESASAPKQAALNQPNGYGDYLLQAGSFSELQNAHNLRTKLHGISPVFVKEANVKGREYFRVMLGPWPSKPKAEQAKHRLKRLGYDTIVVAAK